jgi:hypothetical protein
MDRPFWSLIGWTLEVIDSSYRPNVRCPRLCTGIVSRPTGTSDGLINRSKRSIYLIIDLLALLGIMTKIEGCEMPDDVGSRIPSSYDYNPFADMIFRSSIFP